MNRLNADEIKELDRAIDASIPSFSLLARSRDVALIHLLRFHEAYMARESSTATKEEAENAAKHGYDGMNHAVNWIFQFCPEKFNPTLAFDRGAYAEAEALHGAAREYSKVWDLMSLLQRGIVGGVRDSNGVIHCTFLSDINKEMDMASNVIAGPYGPEIQASEPIVSPAIVQSILNGVTIQSVKPQLSYQVPDRLFTSLAERIGRMTSEPWEMDATWDLGGYTLGQLRKFFVTLDTLCIIHGQICVSLGKLEDFLELIIKYHPRNLWEGILAKRSNLPREVIKTILSDLVYDSPLYGPGKKQSHIAYQPIFPFGKNILGVSNYLLFVSNKERNVWDLVSIKRPELHSRLQSLKEKTWIDELQQKVQQLGLNLHPTIKFEFNNQKSDLDALIIDRASHFGLVCELKWLIQPGRVKNALYNDSEIRKGVGQAKLAWEWVRSHPAHLTQHTGLSEAALVQFEFKPLVLCKSNLASGFLREPGVPVINERLFDWILGEPHRKDLKTLWQIGEDLKYLPKEGKHFESIDAAVEFGGVSFMLDGMACLPKQQWTPADIDVS